MNRPSSQFIIILSYIFIFFNRFSFCFYLFYTVFFLIPFAFIDILHNYYCIYHFSYYYFNSVFFFYFYYFLQTYVYIHRAKVSLSAFSRSVFDFAEKQFPVKTKKTPWSESLQTFGVNFYVWTQFMFSHAFI